MTDGRLTRLSVEELLQNPDPEGRLTRLSVEVLLREAPPPTFDPPNLEAVLVGADVQLTWDP